MFQITEAEYENLKSQNAISNWGGRRKLSYAFRAKTNFHNQTYSILFFGSSIKILSTKNIATTISSTFQRERPRAIFKKG